MRITELEEAPSLTLVLQGKDIERPQERPPPLRAGSRVLQQQPQFQRQSLRRGALVERRARAPLGGFANELGLLQLPAPGVRHEHRYLR